MYVTVLSKQAYNIYAITQFFLNICPVIKYKNLFLEFLKPFLLILEN